MANDDKPKKNMPAGSGIGLGIALGVALGAALDNVALGIALGIALGAAFTLNTGHRRHNKFSRLGTVCGSGKGNRYN